MKKAFLVLCIVMMLWFLMPVFLYGILNIGNMSGLVLFLILFLAVWKKEYIPLVIKIVLAVLLVIILFITTMISVHMIIAADVHPSGGETMIILGGGLDGKKPSRMLTGRLKKAEGYLKEHPDTVVIVSGGQGEDEEISEADAMETWLKDHDVKNTILKEDQSTSTNLNIANSLKLIKKNHLNDAVIIATDGFHEYRASLFCKKYGLDFHALSCHTDWTLFPAFYVRELYAVLYQWMTGC